MPVKATHRDILDLCLGKLYFKGGTMVLVDNGDIIAAMAPVGPY
jgi:hypothetical protein